MTIKEYKAKAFAERPEVVEEYRKILEENFAEGVDKQPNLCYTVDTKTKEATL